MLDLGMRYSPASIILSSTALSRDWLGSTPWAFSGRLRRARPLSRSSPTPLKCPPLSPRHGPTEAAHPHRPPVVAGRPNPGRAPPPAAQERPPKALWGNNPPPP